MKEIIEGHGRFLSRAYPEKKHLYESLGKGQSPRALFVACSDSRVDPEFLTQVNPGELFVLRNAGNIVPAHGADAGSVSATIEYAMKVLRVANIIVCGHSGCGAMHALLHPEGLEGLPEVTSWLRQAWAARAVLDAEHPDLTDEATRLDRCIEFNVLTQASNLLTHPSVAARAAVGEVKIYGWVYDIPTGQVRVYDPERHLFEPLAVKSIKSAFPSVLSPPVEAEG